MVTGVSCIQTCTSYVTNGDSEGESGHVYLHIGSFTFINWDVLGLHAVFVQYLNRCFPRLGCYHLAQTAKSRKMYALNDKAERGAKSIHLSVLTATNGD